MTNRHSASVEKKRQSRPSPNSSAAETAIGTKKRGNDGKMYVVHKSSNGVKRWKKVTSAKGSAKRSAKRSAKKSAKRSAKRSAKKSPKRSAKRSVKKSAKRSAKKSAKRSIKKSSAVGKTIAGVMREWKQVHPDYYLSSEAKEYFLKKWQKTSIKNVSRLMDFAGQVTRDRRAKTISVADIKKAEKF